MKKVICLLVLLYHSFISSGQNHAAEFEAIMRSGNSARAFEFVRNMFGASSTKDPFLHFKPRGIKQLISFYSNATQRIEATSLIRFDQTREFWTNYSRQFTAGKWNYKNLYKNDSLAWLAANYSITLIYAHEVGHYMSYNHFYDFADDYSCEEVVANRCLAAFAHAFDGNKNLDKHQQLFIELSNQTAANIPDSNKTHFYTPMEQWCAADPMKNFFDYFESDTTRFLRLYGYAQFRMMEEALVNYKDGSLTVFLQKNFFDFYNRYTGIAVAKPLRYTIIHKQEFKNASRLLYFINLQKTLTGNYFHPQYLTDISYCFDYKGEIYESFIKETRMNEEDTIDANNYSFFRLINNKRTSSNYINSNDFVYIDSMPGQLSDGRSVSSSVDILSTFKNDSNCYYLVREHEGTFSDLELDSTSMRYRVINLLNDNNTYYLRRSVIADSMYRNANMEEQELFMAGVNNGMPVMISNELTKNHEQVISIYPLETSSLLPDPPIWQGKNTEKGYFNMRYPTLYLDEKNKTILLCFWNPVNSAISLLKISEKSSESYLLYERSFQGSYGPKMEVMGLRLVANNRLYVFARTRQPGNSTQPTMQKLLLKW
ncbi:MAG: hypothetical protein HOP10_01235 [Chitinophagaceae bacterium]|nr:hypothetical protein [Chitinophagaceae bacterium]